MMTHWRTLVSVCLLLLAFVSEARSEIVDRILAVVGDRIFTWSAVRAEVSYDAFLNGQPPPPQDLAELDGRANLRLVLSRMVDQALLEQERQLYSFQPPDNGQTQRRLQEIQNRFADLPSYQGALLRYGLQESQLSERLQRESDLLAFIQMRLRPQVQLDPGQVESYYNDVLVPELRRQGQPEIPALEQVRDQIEQLLNQQEVDRLLEQWIRQLRSRAKIRMFL
ncbi:MAG: hypothetical protein HY649_00875 [Acidobacteria bacterium]|nr:hypothetical protein [Acidobacteriota bacterium]